MEWSVHSILRRRLSARSAIWVVFAAVLCVLLLFRGGADESPETGLLERIAEGGDNQNWDEVRPALKAYLVAHPRDPVAHYFYGLSYLHLTSPQLTFAEGEFLTARTLIEETEVNPEALIGLDHDQFAGRIHRKVALVYMRGYREAIRLGLPPGYRVELLRKANTQVEQGLALFPNSPHLREYSKFLRDELGLNGPPAPEIITERAGSGSAI